MHKKRRFRIFLMIALILSASSVPSDAFTDAVAVAAINDITAVGSTEAVDLQTVSQTVSSGMSIEEFIKDVAEVNVKYAIYASDDQRRTKNGEPHGFVSEIDESVLEDKNEIVSCQSTRLIVKADREPDTDDAGEVFGGYDGYYVVQYENTDEAARGKQRLLSQESVQCVEEDEEMQLYASGSDYDYQALKNWSNGEDDSLGIKFINQTILEKSDESMKEMPEVVIAVLDSGVMSEHPFLEGRLLNGINLTSGDIDDVSDGVGHGTSVAGIIADTSLPNIKIMPIKVADNQGKVTASTVIAGIKAAQKNGADIINMSLGGKGSNSLMETAIKEVQEEGIICVAAAGNKGEDASAYYPANIDDVVTVSNLKDKESINSNSNTGDVVDLAAPGTRICTSSNNGGMTTSFSGTSAAAPFVSSAAAMIYTLLYDSERKQEPDSERIITCMYENAVDIGETGKDDIFGYGRLNFLNFDKGTGEEDGSLGDSDDRQPDNGADNDKAAIRIERTEAGFAAEYRILDDSTENEDKNNSDMWFCIAQYDLKGKMLSSSIGMSEDLEGRIEAIDLDETAEVRAFLFYIDHCLAVAKYTVDAEQTSFKVAARISV